MRTDILIVDDRVENLFVLESILDSSDLNIVKATSGNEALGLMLQYEFALVLLDVMMPGMDGIETAELMKGSDKTKLIPIIFITANSKEQMNYFRGYQVGAVDYLFKPIEPVVLKSKVNVFIELYKQKELLRIQSKMLEEKIRELTELKVTNCKLENLSLVDGLTGIPNRRNFDKNIEVECKRNDREKQQISLIMADIDYFKAFNDNYGHLQGDECLIQVSGALYDGARRPSDFVARFGGEEFAVILPNTGAEGAFLIADQLRMKIENLGISHEYSEISKNVTISVGVSTIDYNDSCTVDRLINIADKALYRAKHNGRNRVES